MRYAALSVLSDSGSDLYAVTTEALDLLRRAADRAARRAAEPARPRLLRAGPVRRGAPGGRRRRCGSRRTWACPTSRADAHTTLAHLDQRAGDPVGALRYLEKTLGDARSSSDPAAELRALYSLGGMYFELGLLDRGPCDVRGDAPAREAAGRPWAPYALDARMMIAQVAYVAGDWDDLAAVLDVSGQAPPPEAEALLAATATLVPAGRGERSVRRGSPPSRPGGGATAWWPS